MSGQDHGASLSATGLSSSTAPEVAALRASIPSACDPKHCDDYIDDPAMPECLRVFLDYARSPAHGSLRDGKKPRLFATYKGARVRVVMASRFGDVGITPDLNAEYGYSLRVGVHELCDLSATPHALNCDWHCEQYPHECSCGAASAMSASGQDRNGLEAKPASAAQSEAAGDAL